MDLQTTPETMMVDVGERPSSRLTLFARGVSQVGSPPVMGLLGVLLALGLLGGQAWLPGVLYLLLTAGVPVAYIVWLVRQGRATDLDLSVRAERIRPMLLTLALMLAGWLLLRLGGAPRLLQLLAAANALLAAAFLLVTLYWKISVHCMAGAALAVLSWALLGAAAVPFALSVPVIAWSRLHLRRHTLAQTAVGTLVGAGIAVLALRVYGA